MATGHSMVVKSKVTPNSVKSNTCDSFRMYFLSIETWNTLCTADKAGGRANWYALLPTLLRNSNGSIYLRLNLPLLSK